MNLTTEERLIWVRIYLTSLKSGLKAINAAQACGFAGPVTATDPIATANAAITAMRAFK